ncbi:MAG TPA: hypothetical protein VOB72_07230 [Candidatus Dormibacteraeota bacterium]|nr:hypothetical protein [Candidatus Dormibacteraeota bacterium]
MRPSVTHALLRAVRLVAVLAVVAGAVVVGAASPAEANGPGDFNSCSVPAGWTYDSVSGTLGCGSGIQPLYHVVAPQDNEWACTVPAGFTYDQVSATTGCSMGGIVTWFHLRVAGDAMWACTVPAGFTYDQVSATTGCSSGGIVSWFHLRAPNTGVWACTVPTGFSYDQTSATTGCSSGGIVTWYHLVFVSYGTPLINPGGIVNQNYSSTVSPGDILVIFGRQLSCGTGSRIVVVQGPNTFNLPVPGDPYFYQGPGEYGQINVSLPATASHQQWAVITVYNCNDSVTPFGGIPPSAPYWLFIN